MCRIFFFFFFPEMFNFFSLFLKKKKKKKKKIIFFGVFFGILKPKKVNGQVQCDYAALQWLKYCTLHRIMDLAPFGNKRYWI